MAPRSNDDVKKADYPAATAFTPPYPPEYYGWSQPGPAVLVFLRDSLPRPDADTPGAAAGPTTVDNSVLALDAEAPSGCGRPPAQRAACAVPVSANHPSAPSIDRDGPPFGIGQLPADSSSIRSSQPSAESGSTAASPALTVGDDWRRAGRFSYPAEWPKHISTLKGDITAHYYVRRTCGPPIDAPLDPAGPIADRRCHDPPPLTISNCYGNLRVNVVNSDHVQVWTLKPSAAGPVWVAIDSGDPHPLREGYVLNPKPIEKPHWIQYSSYVAQFAPSRKS